MNRWGTGPLFAAVSISHAAVMALLSHAYAPLFQIAAIPAWLLTTIAVTLIAIGVPWWLVATVTVMRAYNAGTLVTSGVYRWCRHPLYAAWIVCIAPGIALLSASWLVLTTPLCMYLAARLLVRREETYLAGIFGDRYRAYQRRVPCLIPSGWRTSAR